MFTDAGVWDSEGQVTAVQSKAHYFPHLNAVASFRGSVWFANQIALNINHTFQIFDEIVVGMESMFRAQYANHSETIAKCGAEFELYFCGLSESRNQAESYAISSHEMRRRRGHCIDADPWALVRLPDRVVVPCNDYIERRLAARSFSTVEGFGIAAMECQSEVRGKNPRGNEVTGVAGFIQQSTVTRDEISTKILKRFPAEIGNIVENAPKFEGKNN